MRFMMAASMTFIAACGLAQQGGEDRGAELTRKSWSGHAQYAFVVDGVVEAEQLQRGVPWLGDVPQAEGETLLAAAQVYPDPPVDGVGGSVGTTTYALTNVAGRAVAVPLAEATVTGGTSLLAMVLTAAGAERVGARAKVCWPRTHWHPAPT